MTESELERFSAAVVNLVERLTVLGERMRQTDGAGWPVKTGTSEQPLRAMERLKEHLRWILQLSDVGQLAVYGGPDWGLLRDMAIQIRRLELASEAEGA